MDAEAPSEPRIRHITGIGIHELTPEVEVGGGGRGVPFPPPGGSPRARRTSHAGLEIPVGRARAPTLAGEAFNPGLNVPVTPVAPVAPTPGELRPLVRCFVTFSLPEPRIGNGIGSPAASPPHSPLRDKRPPMSRSRTTSLPPKRTPSNNASLRSESPTSPISPSSPRRSQMNGNAQQPASTSTPKRPAAVRRSTLGYSGRSRTVSDAGTIRTRGGAQSTIPFFFSPIHPPSTHPRWAHIEAGDLAPWLSVPEGAGTKVEVTVWIEEERQMGNTTEKKWTKLPDAGGVVDLTHLVPIPRDAALPPNTLQWTFSTHPKSVFYLPPPGTAVPDRDAEKRVVERSLRETRMKKGATVGALHQLVNIQSVIADTQRSIQELQARIDALIASDTDRSVERRDVSERALRVRWITERVSEVEDTTEQTKARITLQRGRLHSRRALLAAAIEREEGNKSKIAELSAAITEVESERSALLPQIYRLRAMHAQTLDFIFPIVSIDPQSLLYSILGVPLPIPVGPKDPAPPLFLPPQLTPEGCPRIDERTTAAALGYAALVVHLISSLGGGAAGLAYPVTFAGSRSHVRDVVSVMQGPRSFPLYAKGVERYRYEYAVFLLNKDIEMLMLESDIKMLDLRHTLANLKSLLLTLSSPDPPPPGPVAGPGWASGAASTASSRKPSAAWAFPWHYRSSSTLCLDPNMASMLSPIVGSRHSASLASASIHSICPTNEDASVPSASAAVSPLPWVHPRADDERLALGVAREHERREPVGFTVGSPHETEDEVDEGEDTDRERDGDGEEEADSDGTETADEKR